MRLVVQEELAARFDLKLGFLYALSLGFGLLVVGLGNVKELVEVGLLICRKGIALCICLGGVELMLCDLLVALLVPVPFILFSCRELWQRGFYLCLFFLFGLCFLCLNLLLLLLVRLFLGLDDFLFTCLFESLFASKVLS